MFDVLNDVYECYIFIFLYENLDVIFQYLVDQDIEKIFEKMVFKG